MKKIHKYEFAITSYQKIAIPKGSKIIHAGLDPNNLPCIWVEVDPHEEEIVMEELFVLGTGHIMPALDLNHLGTFNADTFVWHVYENLGY